MHLGCFAYSQNTSMERSYVRHIHIAHSVRTLTYTKYIGCDHAMELNFKGKKTKRMREREGSRVYNLCSGEIVRRQWNNSKQSPVIRE